MMKEALEVDHPRQWPEAFALVAGVLILLSKGAGFTPSDQMDIRHKQCSRRARAPDIMQYLPINDAVACLKR